MEEPVKARIQISYTKKYTAQVWETTEGFLWHHKDLLAAIRKELPTIKIIVDFIQKQDNYAITVHLDLQEEGRDNWDRLKISLMDGKIDFTLVDMELVGLPIGTVLISGVDCAPIEQTTCAALHLPLID